MTFSICASVDGCHGAAIATKAIAVGSTAPFVCRQGAVCTQAMTNTPIGVRTVRQLRRGEAIDDAVVALLAADGHAETRQVHGIDETGSIVRHTGAECIPHAGDRQGDSYTVGGNMLSDPAVLDSIAEAFESSAGEPIDRRLLAALRAGEDAGGDKRGPTAQSAAIAVFDPDTARIEHDLRVDESDDAVSELERIHEVAATAGAEWAAEYPQLDIRRNPE